MAWNHSSCCIRMLITLVCGHARCGLSFQPGEFSSRVSWHLLISSWEPEPGGTLLKHSLSFTVRGACVVFSRDLGLLCPSPGWYVYPQGGVSNPRVVCPSSPGWAHMEQHLLDQQSQSHCWRIPQYVGLYQALLVPVLITASASPPRWAAILGELLGYLIYAGDCHKLTAVISVANGNVQIQITYVTNDKENLW